VYFQATLDTPESIFTKIVKPTYDKCDTEVGKVSTDRGPNRLKEHLLRQGKLSPFAVHTVKLAQRLVQIDQNNINKILQLKVDKVYQDMYAAVNNLVAEEQKTEDLAQAAAREEMASVVGVLKADLITAHEAWIKVQQKY
jgi:hypothetical protein